MTDSNATDTRNIIVDLPDYPDDTVVFRLRTFFAASGTEGFPKKAYILTLSATGQGTQALPVGSGAWVWDVLTPDGENYRGLTLAAGADLQLTTWLSAALSSETAASLEDSFVLKTGDTMTGLLTLSGAPTVDLHAATKKYVDDNAGGAGGMAAATYDPAAIEEQLVGLTAAQTLTTKTIDADSNTLSNLEIGAEVDATLTANLDAQGNDITDMGDITFKTGAAGGVLRTGTAAADKFILAAYDVDGGVYRTVIELDAGNDVVMQLIADYLKLEDAADPTKDVEFDISGATTGTATTFIFVQTAARSITFPDETGTVLTNQGGTLAGDFNMADNLITRSAQKDTAEVANNLGNVSGTMTIDYTDGQYVSATLTGNVTTLTINNWPASGRVGYLTLELTPASNTMSWTGITWVGDEPVLNGTVHFVVIWTRDGGTTKYAVHTGSTA